MNIQYFHPRAADLLGFIPDFLSESDPRPAAEQFDERYAHGGGWRPMEGWLHVITRPLDQKILSISYPGDPVLSPVASLQLRDETIWVYQNAWVAIEQPDGAVEISRMD